MGSKLYYPWGEPAATAGETYSAGFQSQPTDADTGYVDMTTRLYSPTQGRFSSRDVLFGDTNAPSSMNQYGYAEGNPVTLWDPSGMTPIKCTKYAFESATHSQRKVCISKGVRGQTDEIHQNVWGFHQGSESGVTRFWLRTKAYWWDGDKWNLATGSVDSDWWDDGASQSSPRHLKHQFDDAQAGDVRYRVKGLVCIEVNGQTDCGDWLTSPSLVI